MARAKRWQRCSACHVLRHTQTAHQPRQAHDITHGIHAWPTSWTCGIIHSSTHGLVLCRLGRSASARALEVAVIQDVLAGVLPPEVAAAELELDDVRGGACLTDCMRSCALMRTQVPLRLAAFTAAGA